MSNQNSSVNPVVSNLAAASVAKQTSSNPGVIKESSVAAFNKMMESSSKAVSVKPASISQKNAQNVSSKSNYQSLTEKLKGVPSSQVTMEMVKEMMKETIVRSGIRRSQYRRDINNSLPKIDK